MKSSNFPHAVNPGPRAVVFVFAVLSTCLTTQVSAQVNVSISPSLVTMATLATQPFTATVSGSSNTAVTWQVNGVSGGNSASGLISTTVLGTANEAIFVAPSAVPSPASVSVTCRFASGPDQVGDCNRHHPVAVALRCDLLRIHVGQR